MASEEEVTYDLYGFLVDEDSKEYIELPDRKKFSREHKWRDLLDEWEDKVVHAPEIINARVYKGIPHTLRARVWKAMVDLEDVVAQHPQGYYESLLAQEGKKEHEEQIWLDIPRTFPDHLSLVSEQGRESLFKVLRAYSIYNPGVGYCQGMSYVAAVLLMFMSPEESFWMLRILLSRDNLDGFYNPRMSKLIENAHIFAKMFDSHLPLLSKHLTLSKVDPLLYVTPWWMCTFTGIPYWDIVMRIWDCFVWEGGNATYRFALAILQLLEDDLLAVQGAEGLLPILLRPNLTKYGQDALLKVAMDIPVQELLAEAEAAIAEATALAAPQNLSETPTKSPRKRKVIETSKSSFFGRFLKNFTPAVPLRKKNKESTSTEHKQRTPQSRKKRKSLSKTRRIRTLDSSFATSFRKAENGSPLHNQALSPIRAPLSPLTDFNSPTCVPLLASPSPHATPSTPLSTPHKLHSSHLSALRTPSPGVRTTRSRSRATPKSSVNTTNNSVTNNSITNGNNDTQMETPTTAALNSPFRRINIRSAAMKLEFGSPTKKSLLNAENIVNFQNCISPPDATYEQKLFVKEFSTPTPSKEKGRVRFALGEVTPIKGKISEISKKGGDRSTPTKTYEFDEGEGDEAEAEAEEMVEIKRATKRRRKGFTGVPAFEY